MLLSDDILDRISSGSSDGKGRECNYFKLDENSGLKVYSCPKKAEDCHTMQGICYEVGLAPKLLSDVFEIQRDCKTYYAFITEHLSLLSNADFPIEDKINQVHELEAEYQKKNIYFYDSCLFNIGIMSDGRLCAVDFGDFAIA